MIPNIIKKVNSQKTIFDYNNKEFILSLKESDDIDFYIQNYDLKENEKIANFAKNDISFFSPSEILSNLISKQICLVPKNENLINLKEKRN